MRATAFLLMLLAAAPAAACELDRPVVFAGLDWQSAAFHNAVAGFILEHGYGCDTDSIPGSTIPLLQGVAQGEIDVAMEIWKDNVTEVWSRALLRGRVKELGVNFPDAVQGWYVPRYVIEGDPARGIAPMAPDLKSVSDLPAHKDLFADPEEPSKGRFYNCVAGWNCEVINTAKLRAYKLNDHFTNFRPGTGAALFAAIAGANLKGAPILAYAWEPTWVMGRFDMVKLEEPRWNEMDWDGLAEEPDDYPRAVAYPVVPVWVGVNAAFAESAPALVTFLSAYRTSAALVNEALSQMEGSSDGAEGAARAFLKNHPEVWRSWLDEETATSVAAALH